MLQNVGTHLSKTWGTGLLAEPDMFGFMVLVRLPDDIIPVDKPDSTEKLEKPSFTDKHAEKLQDTLHYSFKVEVHVAYNNM